MRKLIYMMVILIAAVPLLAACTNDTADSNTTTDVNTAEEQTMEKVEIIHDTPEVFESHMQGEYLLLDVRTPEEYNEGNIEGSVLIPVTELESRLSEIEEYKDKTVLVYCRSGNRSVTASNILIDNGFTNVHNLLTGYNGWVAYKK